MGTNVSNLKGFEDFMVVVLIPLSEYFVLKLDKSPSYPKIHCSPAVFVKSVEALLTVTAILLH